MQTVRPLFLSHHVPVFREEGFHLLFRPNSEKSIDASVIVLLSIHGRTSKDYRNKDVERRGKKKGEKKRKARRRISRTCGELRTRESGVLDVEYETTACTIRDGIRIRSRPVLVSYAAPSSPREDVHGGIRPAPPVRRVVSREPVGRVQRLPPRTCGKSTRRDRVGGRSPPNPPPPPEGAEPP